MNSDLKIDQDLLIKRIRNRLIFKLFSLFKLPMAFLSGLKIETLTKSRCHASVQYKYLNKNPFNSIYFAVLSMAAELSTGALALISTEGLKSEIAFIITKMKAEFFKKAKGKTTFICRDGKKFYETVEIVRKNKISLQQRVYTFGYNENGDLIAKFEFVWSFKNRTR